MEACTCTHCLQVFENLVQGRGITYTDRKMEEMGWGLSWGFSWQFVWILRAGWSPVTSGLGTQNACPPVIPQPPSWGLCLHVCLCNCVSCICVWTPGGLCVPVSVFPCLCISVSLPVYPSLSAPSASEEETWLLG